MSARSSSLSSCGNLVSSLRLFVADMSQSAAQWQRLLDIMLVNIELMMDNIETWLSLPHIGERPDVQECLRIAFVSLALMRRDILLEMFPAYRLVLQR